MKIIEYRIFMPLTVEENQIGQLWSFAEVSRRNTSGGEGVQILHNEEFEVPLAKDGRIINKHLPDYETSDSKTSSKSGTKPSKSKSKNKLSKENNVPVKAADTNSTNIPQEDGDDSEFEEMEVASTKNNINSKVGQYTKKDYFMASKFPWYIRKILPKELATIHERSWNMYPTVKTFLTNDYFKNSFRIQLDTITRNVTNAQCDENAHYLTREQLAKREIVIIDIADQVPPNDYKEDEDPLLFKSTKTDRGPLVSGWINSQKNLSCVHKLVTIDFKVFGLQTKMESYLKNMYEHLFRQFHRQIFCWMDGWYGLNIADVREIEQKLAMLLQKTIEEGEITKTSLLSTD